MKWKLKFFLKNRQGFTLVELIIVIAIIGVLMFVVLASIQNSRNNATISNYKTTIKSLQVAINFCCTSGTALLLAVEGGSVCNPAMSTALLPTKGQLRASAISYVVTAQCNTTNPAITVRPSGLPKAACNVVTTVLATGIGVAFPAGC